MARQGVELIGEIIDCIPGGKFKVRCTEGPSEVIATCTISGKMRSRAPDLRLVLGDSVKVLLNMSDLTQGRIEWVIRERR